MTAAAVAPSRRASARLPGQLSLYDEFDFYRSGRDLRRLGEGRELGELLIQPLLLRGWRLHEPFPGFAGDGFVFVLERGGVEVRRTGASLADVAVDLFKEAAAMPGIWDGDE